MNATTPSKFADRPPSLFEPQAILFDFDGVIVHSEPLHFQAFRATLAAEGINLTESQYYAHLIGFDDGGVFCRVFELHRRVLDAETLRRLMADKGNRMLERIRQGGFESLAGVSLFIQALARTYPLAICSGARRAEIEWMLDAIGLRGCFLFITAAEDVAIGKPNPMGYLQTLQDVAERTGRALTPANALVIEDAPSVIRSVMTAGFKTLAIAGSHPLPDLAHADQAVPHLTIEAVARVYPRLRLGD